MKKYILVSLFSTILLFNSCITETDIIPESSEDELLDISLNLIGSEWLAAQERPMNRLEENGEWLYIFKVINTTASNELVHAEGVTSVMDTLKIKVNKNFEYRIEIVAQKLLGKDFENQHQLLDPFYETTGSGYREIDSFADIEHFLQYPVGESELKVKFWPSPYLRYSPPAGRGNALHHLNPQIDYFIGALNFTPKTSSNFEVDLFRGTYGVEIKAENFNFGHLEFAIGQEFLSEWPSANYPAGTADFIKFSLLPESNTVTRLFANNTSSFVITDHFQYDQSINEPLHSLFVRYTDNENQTVFLFNTQIRLKRNTIRTFNLDLNDFVDQEELTNFNLRFMDNEWSREEEGYIRP